MADSRMIAKSIEVNAMPSFLISKIMSLIFIKMVLGSIQGTCNVVGTVP